MASAFWVSLISGECCIFFLLIFGLVARSNYEIAGHKNWFL